MSRTEPAPAAEAVAVAATFADSNAMHEQARAASEFLKALAHEGRLLLLCLLAEQERTVSELCGILGLRQANISQQLARLRLDGMVMPRRVGKTVRYSLANEDVRRVLDAVQAIFCPGGSHPPEA
jgi:DNA-binding transcriptional ArsR family regulator